MTKDMGKLKYFLEIEIIHHKHRLVYQRKYVLDYLDEIGLLGYKPTSTLNV